MSFFVHKLADVQTEKIGIGTKIWQFVIVLKDATIGKNCNINSNVFIENDVVIGDNVTVKSGVQIWDGIVLEDNVFIGPNVTFTNDLTPRSKQYPSSFEKTIVRRGASIGANSTIIAGNVLGEFSLVGAGSVVTKSIGKNQVWFGNPAKHTGYITNEGVLLDLNLKQKKSNIVYMWNNNNELEKIDD